MEKHHTPETRGLPQGSVPRMERGVTLIELLVVIGIIGILSGVLMGVFSGSTDSARAAKCQAHMRNLAMAVQAYGMRHGAYPRAASVERYQTGSKNTETVAGWLGTRTTDPYDTSKETREKCFDGGAIWDEMKHGRESYVCPSHQRYAREHNKEIDPLWSYAMNAYFNVGAATGKPLTGTVQRHYALRRAERYLLFAEVPFAKMRENGADIQSGSPSASELDPVLYGDSEVIGFNHKNGRHATGHVCFADGHVERLRAPAEKGNISDLTKWLCNPRDEDRGDFDVSFDGTRYERDFKEAEESAE